MKIMRELIVASGDDRSVISFTQGNCTTFVVLEGLMCLVVSDTFENRPSIPHIPYVFNGRSQEEAYQKFVHLMGKFCLKKENSKYFGCPRRNEHCLNGRPGNVPASIWEQKAVEAVARYKSAEI